MGVKNEKPMDHEVRKITVGNSHEVATQLEPKCPGGTFLANFRERKNLQPQAQCKCEQIYSLNLLQHLRSP